MSELILSDKIEDKIFIIRGHKVMIDADLAVLYGVSTKRLNEQVRRNSKRFPEDFMFKSTKHEQHELVANCDRLSQLRHSTSLPHVFTEYGAIMLASVINSQIAVQTSIQVVRAFARLREIISSNKDLARKLAVLEKKYDHQFKIVFEAIRQLMEEPLSKNKKIGFLRERN